MGYYDYYDKSYVFWDKFWRVIAIATVVLIVVGMVISFTPAGRGIWNSVQHHTQKVDDATNYKTRKQVEDTCRATIVSYESDKLTWEQYKDSESAEQRGWADSAKIRANKAALTYNEYFLKNSYVFDGNVPEDIKTELPLIE